MTDSLSPIPPATLTQDGEAKSAKAKQEHFAVTQWGARLLTVPVGLTAGWLIGAHYQAIWSFLEVHDKQIMGLATIALVGVTAALALYTARLWSEAKEAGGAARKDSARIRRVMIAQQRAMIRQGAAMQKAADAAVASERAFVFLNTSAVNTVNPARPNAPGMEFTLAFINLGKTPGEVESMDWTFRVVDVLGLQRMTAHPDGTRKRLDFQLGNEATSDGIVISLSANSADIGMVSAGVATVVILGRLWHSDVFRNRYEYGFAIEVTNREDGRVRNVQNADLNYTRKC